MDFHFASFAQDVYFVSIQNVFSTLHENYSSHTKWSSQKIEIHHKIAWPLLLC
jgi:hypothetical protein